MNQLQKHALRVQWTVRGILTVLAVAALGPIGLLAIFINPLVPPILGTSYPVINATTLSNITTLSTNAQEILWEREIVEAAAQTNPFADNMTGGVGSGKPIISKNDTTKVAGQEIVVSTLDVIGGPGVQGNGTRVGGEDKIKPGDFKLKVDLWWCGLGIDNTGQSQTVVGAEWDAISQKLITRRLAKKQSDDNMQALKVAGASFNTVYPNGKTLDTLSSSDTYQTSLIVKAGGLLKDNGAIPMDARKVTSQKEALLPPIQRYMMFLTDVGARPIKTEPAYLEGVKMAKERGDNNNLFTGEYSVWDNHVIYSWVNVQHSGYGSIGSALQPEALLGTAIVAKATSTTMPTGVDGGGSNAAAAYTPAVLFFEFFSLYAYVPINGVTQTYNTGTRYFAVKNITDGKMSFFSFTGNSGHQLTGLTRLGSTTSGDYNTTVGDVTWNSGAWTTAADGLGYQGLSEAIIAVGSKIYETNSKGVPLCYGFGLGEMALVCGYGKLPNGKTMASKTYYEAPHGQARASGMEVSYGSKAFLRPDSNAPNHVLYAFARDESGFPLVS